MQGRLVYGEARFPGRTSVSTSLGTCSGGRDFRDKIGIYRQSLTQAIVELGWCTEWCVVGRKADFVNELSDDAIGVHMRYAPQIPTMLSTVHLYPVNGAASRVGKEETAWSYRDATWAQVIAGIDPDPAKKDCLVEWASNYWEALHSYSAGGAYVNFMMDEGEDRVKATYRDNYERLAAIKSKYDPDNLFRINQNVKPKAVNLAQERAS